MQIFNRKRKIVLPFPTVKICKTCFKRRGVWRTKEDKAICRSCARKDKAMKIPHFYGLY